MRALITGGRGYIGENLAEMLENPLIYDLTDGNDIMNGSTLHRAMSKVDVCFHLAAVSGIQTCEDNPLHATETNLLGTINVARIALYWGKPMVFASSFAVLNPTNVYAMTKYLGEKAVLALGGNVVRIANVYGGDNYTQKKNSAVAALMKGTWENRGLGKETRNFIHVEDVCQVLIDSLNPPMTTITEACCRSNISINKLIELSKDPSFPDNLRRLGGECI